MVGLIELRGRLPPSTRLATGQPSFSGLEAEVGQLVVEKVAVDHQPRAEAALDRRGLRRDIAPAVDRDEVRGAALRLLRQACKLSSAPAGSRRRTLAIVAVGEISAERLAR